MSLLGICNAYTMRVCLNLAIIQMVNQTKTIDSHYDPDACPVDHVVGDSEANKTIIEIPVSYSKYICIYRTILKLNPI